MFLSLLALLVPLRFSQLSKTGCLVLLFFSASLFAQNDQQRRLLDKNQRPLMEEVMKSAKLLEPLQGVQANRRHMSAVRQFLPYLIVGLEKAFPGATFGFLGRDVFGLADALDAFYLSHGQKGRVARIPFSTPSTQGLTSKNIIPFLSQHGLNTSRSSGPEFVLIDWTSFSPERDGAFLRKGSQSWQIQNKVILGLKALRFSASQIVERFNVVTLINSGGIDDRRLDIIDLKGSFTTRSEIQNVKSQQIQSIRNNTLKKIFTLGLPQGETRQTAYAQAWTGKFGPIRKQRNGSFATRPLHDASTGARAEVLSSMIEYANLVSQKEFQLKVQRLFRKQKLALSSTKGSTASRSMKCSKAYL